MIETYCKCSYFTPIRARFATRSSSFFILTYNILFDHPSKSRYPTLFKFWTKVDMLHNETRREWLFLKNHQEEMSSHRMQDWFNQDKQRFERFSLYVGELLLDYSKNRITPETMERLCQLAESMRLP